jgi:hypothetical protein
MPQSDADLLKLTQALAVNHPARENPSAEEGEGGGSSGGQGGTVIEKRLFAETFGLIRNGEKEFGVAHEFDQLAYLAKSEPGNLKGELGQQHESGSRLKQHPILSKLSKFDGDTPNMSMDPTQNSEAQERYEHKLKLAMAMQNRPQIAPKPM